MDAIFEKVKEVFGVGESADKLKQYFNFTFWFQAAMVLLLGLIFWKKK